MGMTQPVAFNNALTMHPCHEEMRGAMDETLRVRVKLEYLWGHPCFSRIPLLPASGLDSVWPLRSCLFPGPEDENAYSPVRENEMTLRCPSWLAGLWHDPASRVELDTRR